VAKFAASLLPIFPVPMIATVVSDKLILINLL
jgi:hypothetical protein